jgi:hypothetical protein
MHHDIAPYAMIETARSIDGPLLASILSAIGDADAAALRHFDHSRAGGDPDACARAASGADDRANRARALARNMIERAFPGVTWPMIERAGL